MSQPPPLPPLDPLIGEIIGDYRVERQRKKGGMGAVYLARHQRTEVPAAFKVLHLTAPLVVSHFKGEALALAKLIHHPNIVYILDSGCMRNGHPYLVMEWLEGEDLDTRIQRAGPLSLEEGQHLCRQTGGALDFAHQRGVVHRDIKPPNLFLCKYAASELLVKVLDFGIAKLMQATTALTTPGMLMGTYAYLPPEAYQGQHADSRWDQWSLAVTLCYSLSGKLPFVGAVPAALMQDILTHQPRLPDGLPSTQRQALQRALAKDPNERFATMADFVAAFTCARPLAPSPPPVTEVLPPPPPTPSSLVPGQRYSVHGGRRGGGWLIGAGALLMAIGGAAALRAPSEPVSVVVSTAASPLASSRALSHAPSQEAKVASTPVAAPQDLPARDLPPRRPEAVPQPTPSKIRPAPASQSGGKPMAAKQAKRVKPAKEAPSAKAANEVKPATGRQKEGAGILDDDPIAPHHTIGGH